MASMSCLLKQRRMRWLGHLVQMEDGRIPKDLLDGELAVGKHPTERPKLHYKDIWKQDLQALNIDLCSWKNLALGRLAWKLAVQNGISNYEKTDEESWRKKRMAEGTLVAPLIDSLNKVRIHSLKRLTDADLASFLMAFLKASFGNKLFNYKPWGRGTFRTRIPCWHTDSTGIFNSLL